MRLEILNYSYTVLNWILFSVNNIFEFYISSVFREGNISSTFIYLRIGNKIYERRW